ncbi:hypothetical protein WMY93_031566 [Mugilogobius chulae]|uniref:Aldehyde oxidase/xanthine dehydrogenase a/b hammerhead domain-containing protein n=1 Tax=Mugilogobius chulae TaxID=88201 RepID=A0AAW0MG29_9GOBI
MDQVKLSNSTVKEGSRTVHMDQHFFTGYRRTVVRPAEVLVSVELPFSRPFQVVRAFKTSRRREDDISVVTATFNVTFEPETSRVHDLKMAFGGMGPTTVLALSTSNALQGRLWGEELLQTACSSLAAEMTLDPSAPGGMSLKQQGLKVEPVPPECLSATEVFHPPAPSSAQLYQVHSCGRPLRSKVRGRVGRPLVHVSAQQQPQEKLFTATTSNLTKTNLPEPDPQLPSPRQTTVSKAPLRPTYCPSTALRLAPCRRSFVFFWLKTSQDNWTGPIVYDETVFAQREVTCVGHVIGAVVAETQADAQRAAKSVKIEYEDLPAVITIEDAIKAQSFYQPIRTIQNGDLEAGFQQSHHILEGSGLTVVSGSRSFSESGRVLAPGCDYYSNVGNSMDLSLSVMERRSVSHGKLIFDSKHSRSRHLCRTNLPSNTAFRGFGGPQGMLVCEDWIQNIALKLGRSAEEIRELNLFSEGDRTPYNQVLEGLTLRRCWTQCLDRVKIHERRDQIQEFNRYQSPAHIPLAPPISL